MPFTKLFATSLTLEKNRGKHTFKTKRYGEKLEMHPLFEPTVKTTRLGMIKLIHRCAVTEIW